MVNKKLLMGMLVIATMLVLGITVTNCVEEPTEEKEINWNGHRYKRIGERKTWTEAKEYCESQGGHLVTITSTKENEAVYNLIADGAKNVYWIGGYLFGDGWVWVTGEKWEYTNWAPGEPNDRGGNESCIQMYRLKNYDDMNVPGMWNDIGRSGLNDNKDFYTLENTGFICEWD